MKTYKWSTDIWKKFSITNPQGHVHQSENKNHNITSHLNWLLSKKIKYKYLQGCRGKGTLFITDENVNWYHHNGNRVGSSSDY